MVGMYLVRVLEFGVKEPVSMRNLYDIFAESGLPYLMYMGYACDPSQGLHAAPKTFWHSFVVEIWPAWSASEVEDDSTRVRAVHA